MLRPKRILTSTLVSFQGVTSIKPANILIQDGEPVVSDFGIALAVGAGGGDRLTETGLSLGTPYYMSPEQATGDQPVGSSTDTYALGSVLYEMLVGEPPYPGTTTQAVLGKIIAGKPVSATEHRSSVPPNVDAAVRCALEKLPADRFGSVQEFVRALEDEHFRYGDEAAAGASVGRGQWTPVAMALGALALGLTLVLGWSLLRPDPSQPVIRFSLDLPEDLLRGTGGGVNLDIFPDGSRIVFVAGQPSQNQLWQRPLDQLAPTPVSGTENARSPRFSPDGTSLAFTLNGGLTTVPLTGAPPLTVVTDSVAGNLGLAWGRDGRLYFVKAGLGIWSVSANGGEQEEVTDGGLDNSNPAYPEALPNGRGILFTRRVGSAAESGIAVLSFETGEIRPLFQGTMARYAHSGHIVYASADGTLFAAPFDLSRLEVTGPSRTLLEGITVIPALGSYFSLSETGSLVYRPGGGQVLGGIPVWVSRNGSEEVLDPRLTGAFRAPTISPDGRRVAWEHAPVGSSTMDIWIYDMDQGGAFSRLTFEGGMFDPFWSPDGREVGYRFGEELYAQAWDGSGSARLLRNPQEAGRIPEDVVWTPDGRWLVYREGAGGGRGNDLFYGAPHPDSTSVAILETPFNELAPSLSPDGRWLAYQSDESGRHEAYVRPFPGPGGRVPVSLEGGLRPIWASNQREIFYVAGDASRMIATVRTDPEFVVESRESFASAAGFYGGTGARLFSLAPDDQRLLAGRLNTGRQANEDILVLNFFEMLREVVPD